MEARGKGIRGRLVRPGSLVTRLGERLELIHTVLDLESCFGKDKERKFVSSHQGHDQILKIIASCLHMPRCCL